MSDNSGKYFSFLVYGEMPSSAVIGQNYSFTADVILSGVLYSFQHEVTASDTTIPQAVRITLENRNDRSWFINLKHNHFFCIFAGRYSNPELIAVFFHYLPRWSGNYRRPCDDYCKWDGVLQSKSQKPNVNQSANSHLWCLTGNCGYQHHVWCQQVQHHLH